MIEQNNIPQVNNSKKISQLRGRDAITYHQDHSWIAIAQYNDKIGSYHNLAMNISSITSYAITKAIEETKQMLNYEINNFLVSYNISYLNDLSYFVGEYDYDKFSNIITQNTISYNLISYSNEYNLNSLMWDYYPNKESIELNYIMTDNNEYLLSENSKKIKTI